MTVKNDNKPVMMQVQPQWDGQRLMNTGEVADWLRLGEYAAHIYYDASDLDTPTCFEITSNVGVGLQLEGKNAQNLTSQELRDQIAAAIALHSREHITPGYICWLGGINPIP